LWGELQFARRKGFPVSECSAKRGQARISLLLRNFVPVPALPRLCQAGVGSAPYHISDRSDSIGGAQSDHSSVGTYGSLSAFRRCRTAERPHCRNLARGLPPVSQGPDFGPRGHGRLSPVCRTTGNHTAATWQGSGAYVPRPRGHSEPVPQAFRPREHGKLSWLAAADNIIVADEAFITKSV
jgi:hypothetical protein